MKKTLLLAVVLCLAFSASAFAAVSGGPHDLSTASTTTGVDEICVFCHHPHNTPTDTTGGEILWNMNDISTGTFSMYASQFLNVTTYITLGGVDANGKQGTAECMSCHDGVITTSALEVGTMTGSYTLTDNGILGMDLRNDHPVSFDYDAVQATDSELKSIDAVKASAGGITFYGTNDDVMGCASCHDVHNETYGMFLRTTLAASVLCLECHIK
jgi:predicted CXXCH cytochrome family protein